MVKNADEPCACGSGRKYVWCCAPLDPDVWEAIFDLASQPRPSPEEDPRPDRWQADIVSLAALTFAERRVVGGAALVAVAAAGTIPVVLALDPVAEPPSDPEEAAALLEAALLESVDGYAEELPHVIEIRREELREPLSARLAGVDVASTWSGSCRSWT